MLSKEQEIFIDNLYREMYRKLHSYASIKLRDSHLSEEAVQDTFRIACAKIDVLYSSSKPEGWLFLTLRNVIRNMQKNQSTLNKYIIEVLDMGNIKAQSYSDEANIDLQYGDIAKSDDFKLLKRVVLDKYTMLEASTELGISVEACKKRVQRIKKKLRDDFQGDM